MVTEREIEEYHKRERERERARNRYHTLSLPKHLRPQDYNSPISASSSNIYYLGFGHNTWHGTWGSYLNPGSFSFYLKDLRSHAEALRVQGSQFEIDVCSATILIYKTKAVALAFVGNGCNRSLCDSLFFVRGADLTDFWKAHGRGDLSGLYALRFKEFREELLTKETPRRCSASSQGSGKTLKWHDSETSSLYEDQRAWFVKFRNKSGLRQT